MTGELETTPALEAAEPFVGCFVIEDGRIIDYQDSPAEGEVQPEPIPGTELQGATAQERDVYFSSGAEGLVKYWKAEEDKSQEEEDE